MVYELNGPSTFLHMFNWIALMMETVSISETSVNLYETVRRSIPEGSHLRDVSDLILPMLQKL
jgi:hypothetical protein